MQVFRNAEEMHCISVKPDNLFFMRTEVFVFEFFAGFEVRNLELDVALVMDDSVEVFGGLGEEEEVVQGEFCVEFLQQKLGVKVKDLNFSLVGDVAQKFVVLIDTHGEDILGGFLDVEEEHV